MQPVDIFKHRPIAVPGSPDGLRFAQLIAGESKNWRRSLFQERWVLERAPRFELRRFSTGGPASEATTIFLNVVFAVTGMTSFLSDPQRGLRWMFWFHSPAIQAFPVLAPFRAPS